MTPELTPAEQRERLRRATQREFLTRAQAAAYLEERGLTVAKSTLQKWATTGGGPPYRIFGNKAVYTTPELDDWAQQRLSEPRSSTSRAPA